MQATHVQRPPGRIVTRSDTVHPKPLVVSLCAASPASRNATWRAALVARDLGARLHILHPAPRASMVSREQASLHELAEDIRQRTRVDVSIEAVEGNVLRHAVAASREAALVVLPSLRANPLREWIMGTQAERLIRLCRSPVLVVKRPALLAYRRVLVPLDLEDHAVPLITVAASLSRGSRLEVLHALDDGDEQVLQGMDGADEAVRGFRQHRAQGAFLALHRLIAAAEAGDAGAEAAIEFGEAPAVVLARARAWDAELMVIGKAQRGLLANYFLGGLTQRMLAQAPSDVLVHPERLPRAASESIPVQRPMPQPLQPGPWGTLVRSQEPG
ncbi:universal stress protein [Ramlibacter alkalitolerans]|uniref:Universal stress protein n=1 Tax=Ramlibacter alkalitolerans TaxID=2039631 RepID=A0ABS1JTJ8_9BURK|nr:universal stress protein [Ramlibacter alkalitolerans]MBL0427491.1 universal stress protein [Ramlibacter alkalitolerans]